MSSIHNIYDTFLYKYKKFILAFTYTPGFNIDYVIDDIAKTFNFKCLKLDGESMLKPDSQFNYSKLNMDLNNIIAESNLKIKTNSPGFYGQGILIYGLTFPTEKLNFQIDLQLHFSTTISMFLKSNSEPDGKIIYTVDDYNKLKDLIADNKIHKYFNLKIDPAIDLNDAVFDKIIDFIEFKVYGKVNYEKYATKILKEQKSKNDPNLFINPKPVNVFAISEKNELANEKRDELLTDVILSSVSDMYDANDIYPTKKSHTNYQIYKKMAKKIELSDTESKMSDMELLTSNDKSDTDTGTNSSDTNSTDSNSTDSNLTNSESDLRDLMLKEDIDIDDL